MMKCPVNILALSDRAAMGLPDTFVRTPLDDLERITDGLRFRSLRELALIAENPTHRLAKRYAAATILGMAGDTRIDTLAPSMLLVPGGSARIGLEPEEVARVVSEWQHVGVIAEWIEKEAPAFTVEVKPFRIGRYPVTNAEYRHFLEESGYEELPTSWRLGAYPVERANHPVHTISEKAAEAYASWLSIETGRAFRLPTEIEWEWAAAGPTGREFPWGSYFASDRANTIEACIQTTTPVGIFPTGRSWCGADDMGGNVEEYVADDYAPYPGGIVIADDLVTTLGRYRITRGGSFARFGDLARSRRRHGAYPKEIYAVGFRLAEGS